MDHDELAARAAVANWRGQEGAHSRELQATGPLEMEALKRFVNLWGLARSNPLERRERLLDFLNQYAIPALKGIDPASSPSRHIYAVIEKLSQQAATTDVTNGRRPTSLLSKLGLAIRPEIFIPYDSRVNEALAKVGKRVAAHAYGEYMLAVLSEKPVFDQALQNKALSAASLGAEDMSQSLFEMRALDKRLMLRGGFNPATLEREIRVR